MEEKCSTCNREHNPFCSNPYHLERLKKLGYDLNNLPDHVYSLFEGICDEELNKE